jgi:hypothetical protein
METASGPSSISRVDTRYRHRSQRLSSTQHTVPEQEVEKKEERPSADVNESLLVGEERGRTVMGESHRQFHRRAAQEASKVLTALVNVEQTMQGADVVGVATVTPALPVVPAVPTNGVPAVPAVPTDAVPTVPAVPAFPADLTVPSVPGYPFSAAAATPSETLTEPTSTEPTPTVPTPTESTSVVSATSSSFNSTASSCKCCAPFSSVASDKL